MTEQTKRRYGVILGGVTPSRIVLDPESKYTTLAEAKQALAQHVAEQIITLTAQLALLTTASLPDLISEEAEEWHRRVTSSEKRCDLCEGTGVAAQVRPGWGISDVPCPNGCKPPHKDSERA